MVENTKTTKKYNMESLCKIKWMLFVPFYINLFYHYQELKITELSLHMQDHPKYSQNSVSFLLFDI